jgi:hypothetical protein
MKLSHIAAGLLVLAIPGKALAGPPILCNPIDIAKANSIPIGSGSMEPASGCSGSTAVDEALAILKGDASPLVRMETIRRATVYVMRDQSQAKNLLTRVMALELDAAASGNDSNAATALFDAGFLAACLGEVGVELGWKPGAADGLQGYGWIKAALDKLPKDSSQRAEMEFGAALAAHPMDHREAGARAIYDAHLQRAAKGAKEGSLLADNIKAHHAKWDQYLKKDEGSEKDVRPEKATKK